MLCREFIPLKTFTRRARIIGFDCRKRCFHLFRATETNKSGHVGKDLARKKAIQIEEHDNIHHFSNQV